MRFGVLERPPAPHDHVAVLAQGQWEEVAHRDLPLAPGQETMVKLERGPDGDALALVGDYRVLVGGAAGKAGRRMKIRVTLATPTGAFAVLTSAKPPTAPVQAETIAEDEEAESSALAAAVTPAETPAPPDEEETPKRPRRSSRGGRGGAKKAVAAAGDEAPAEPAPAEAPAEPEAVEPEADGAVAPVDGEAKPKKKTRRGTRGGRGRKKKAPAADKGAGPAEVPVDALPALEPAAPVVLGPDVAPDGASRPAGEPSGDGDRPPADDQEKPKKKTRRGTRGGRNRKRKAPASPNGAATVVTADDEVEEPLPLVAPEEGD
jgi:ribonuclease E